MMKWLPAPRDFRAALQTAMQVSEPVERIERIASLAQYELGFVDTIQLSRALDSFTAEVSSGFSRVRLALLASATVEHLVPAIRVAGVRRKLLIDVHTGTYGQYRQDLLNPSSALYRFAPEMVLFSLTARETIAGVRLMATAGEVDKVITRSIDELRLLWRRAREAFKATIIQQTFLDASEPLFGSFDRLMPGAPRRVIARLNDRVCEAAALDGISVLDIAGVSARDGLDEWFDRARWFQAKQEIAPQAAPAYGEQLARVVAAQRGLSKKCLVLDLDNTLWGGVIGDDGLPGIVLGEGSPAGEAHLALQRYSKQLKERGIILAVCSKNDPAIAEAAFENHPDMLLKRSDIAVFVANWNDKVDNLKAVAAKLNIGIDSLVFVDDNPAERDRMRQALPMVAVPELPMDVSDYVPCLAEAGYFEAVSFTSEDQQRAGYYAANTARESARGSAQSMDEFLDRLEMSLEFGPFAAVDVARLTQLINKTNQFNLTIRRYTSNDVAGFVTAPDVLTLQFRLSDRYGDNGLVSAMIFRPTDESSAVLELDTWVMSCRVFGRQVEHEAMNIAVEAARHRGARTIFATYLPTERNGLVRELYSELGFTAVKQCATTNGATRWVLDLADYAPRHTYIARKSAYD